METQEQPSPENDELAVFLEGAKHGHILYRQAHQGKPLAPQTMYDLLMRMLLDTTHPSVWNAGYITGWYLAKYQAGDTTVMNETLVNEGAVQFKGGCLHWPFTLREE